MNELTGTGVYLVQMPVFHPLVIVFASGRQVILQPGTYYYAGSAQRGLKSRIMRHARREKPLRWHIDYLTCQYPANFCWIWQDAQKNFECEIARTLVRKLDLIPGFGSSDCRCPGHLFCGSLQETVWIMSTLNPAMSFALSEDTPL